jgi:hypothetical protein
VLSYKKQSKIRIAVAIVTALVLTIGLMFSSTITADNSQENDFELASQFLERLMLLVDGDISKDDVTRGEMAFYAAALYGAEPINFYKCDIEVHEYDDADGNPQEFVQRTNIDFTKKDYAEAIKYCVEKGIMDAGWFAKPDANVTLKDAVKILVSTLRYDGIAAADYMTKALTKQVRLLGKHAVFPFDGVSADKILTKNDAVMITYNCLLSEYAVKVDSPKIDVIWNDETMQYEVQKYAHKAVMNMFGMYLATPISSKVAVNGKEIAFDAYTIDGNNYFKLRDLAYALNGTAKQFAIVEHEAGESHGEYSNLVMNTPYTAVSGEMAAKGTDSMTAFRGSMQLYRVKKDVTLSFNPWVPNDDVEYAISPAVYEINGEKYLKLRDFALGLNFKTDYDSAKNTIIIDTNKPYSP